MIQQKNSKTILDKIKNKIESINFMEKNKVNENDFIRNRKLPFSFMIYFMLNSIKQTLQKELTNFISNFTNYNNVTKSAFCQQRLKLKPEAFIELNDELVQEFYTDNIIEKWNDYRLVSIDGSKLELPKSNEILNYFGVNDEINKIPMARISTLFDLKNEIIIDSIIDPHNISEYDQARTHFDKLKEGDLLLMDRGYGARRIFYLLHIKKIDFVIRLQRKLGGNIELFWSSNENSKIIELKELPKKSKQRLENLKIPFIPFKIKLVKVILDNGEVEVLATSLLDEEKYSLQTFKELYNPRWGIEVNYYHLKNHIELGNFTGYSIQVIRQDFYANLFIANIQRIIIRDAQLQLSLKMKNRKYEYKINKNLSLGFMKNKIIELLTNNKEDYYEQLLKLFQLEPVPIRKDRKYIRKEKILKRKYYLNQRRAI